MVGILLGALRLSAWLTRVCFTRLALYEITETARLEVDRAVHVVLRHDALDSRAGFGIESRCDPGEAGLLTSRHRFPLLAGLQVHPCPAQDGGG